MSTAVKPVASTSSPSPTMIPPSADVVAIGMSKLILSWI
jgi:hypothetical protein